MASDKPFMLLKIMSAVFDAQNNKRHALAVFVDLKKAFDTVDQSILLKKFEHYKLPVEWFKSYLANRKQFSFIEGDFSDPLEIFYRIPQGSLLGPLLFLLFINDLPQASSLLSLLYADDTTFFAEHENVDLLYDHVQKELCKAEL
jgi:hypothetical protein